MEHLEQRSPAIVKIVVISISGLALICVLTLCACALMERKPGPEINTALITTLGTLVGALTGLLANTKTVPALSSKPINGTHPDSGATPPQPPTS